MTRKIWPLACRKINGIGPKADEKLQSHGIETIGELAASEPAWLHRTTLAASTGAWLHDAAHGRDERPVVIRQRTGVDEPRDHLRARPACGARQGRARRHLHPTCAKASPSDLQRKGYVGKTIGIKLRYDDFKSVTRDQTLEHYTADAEA